jgi:hypothetical protein
LILPGPGIGVVDGKLVQYDWAGIQRKGNN